MNVLRKLCLTTALILFPCLAFGQGMKREDFFLKPLPAGGVGAVSGVETVCTGAGLATTAASVSANVATLTMASNPLTAGFVNGRVVQVFSFSGTDTYFNGTFTLTSVTSTQLQFALTHADNSASTNGGVVMNPTTIAGCAPRVTVYSDQALTLPITQPFADDGRGNTTFYAAPGNYWVAYSASGLSPVPMTYIVLPLANSAGGSLVSPTITGTDAGAEILQSKTFDISLNTLKNTPNTAGHYPRNNGTQYVDNTIQGADVPATTSNCAGVQFAQGLNTGHTPVCATPPTFVASGASHAVGYVPDPGAGAGTTKFLREDATWVVPAGIAVTAVDLTAQGANIGATTILTPGANGFYRFSCSIVVSRAATTSSTLPQCNMLWTDADSSFSELAIFFGSVSSLNVVGALDSGATTATMYNMFAKSGAAIQYSTTGYASSGATTMQYALHIRLEGPF